MATEQLIATGVIAVKVDSDIQSGVAEGKRAANELGAAIAQSIGGGAEKAATSTAKLETATKRFSTAIEREIAQITLSTDEYRRWEAQAKGIPENVYGPLVQRLTEARTAVNAQREAERALAAQQQQTSRAATAAYATQGAALNQYGMTARATAAALRQVPAQVTDIVVSLQGGQAPLTVLLQQGGQLRDIFGGIVPAARALGGALLGLATNPFVILATALGTVAYGFVAGAKEQSEYVKALALTGARAGVTADQLNGAATATARVVGTQGQASAALAQLVGTGAVTGIRDLTRYTETAVGAQKLLGQNVEDTANAFKDLGRDPVAASLRLNESMGYLTASTFEQIRALVEANRTADAATLAQQEYDRAVRDATQAVTQNLGTIERAWIAVKGAISEAIDAVKNFGRATPAADQIATLTDVINANRRIPGRETVVARDEAARTELLKQQLKQIDNAQLNAQRQEDERRGVAATATAAKLLEEAKSVDAVTRELKKYQAVLADIRRVNPNSELLDPKNIAAVEASIKRRFTPPKAAAVPKFRDDQATKLLIQYGEIEASLRAQLDSESKLTEAEKLRVAFEAQVATLTAKGTLTDDQASLLAKRDEIRAQLDINAALSRAVEIQKDEAREAAKRAVALDREVDTYEKLLVSLGALSDARQDKFETGLSGAGRSDAQRQRLNEARQIEQQYRALETAERKSALTEDRPVNVFRIDEIRRQKDAALAETSDYYKQRDKQDADWTNGALKALETYREAAMNSAEQTADAWTRAFQGMEDVLVSVLTTGKADFRSFVQSILSDIVRMNVKQYITGPAAGAIGGAGGGGGGFGGLVGGVLDFLSTSIFTGGGTRGLSWSYGKAGGGSTRPWSAQQVNENGPELLSIGNKTVLMMGAQGGKVTPLGGGGGVQNNYFTVGDVASASMVERAVARGQRQSAAALQRSKLYRGEVADV